jgi:myo-inositol-1(or 4)-monophosphatase
LPQGEDFLGKDGGVAFATESLLTLATKVAIAAGELLMLRPNTFEIETKSTAIDIATQMDLAAEKLIVDSLLGEREDDGIIAEEGAARTSKSGITWVIDPLDGTVNYFYGLPGWCVSIAAKDRDGALVGVVYAPTIITPSTSNSSEALSTTAQEFKNDQDFKKRNSNYQGTLWHAVRGEGSFCNGVRLKNPSGSYQDEQGRPALDRALIATGFSYSQEKRVEQARVIAQIIPMARDIRRLGAAAVDLCHVGAGTLDAFFERGLNEWDLAAGGLVASEAGAIVTGGETKESIVIAANAGLHELLREQISRAEES